MELCVLKFAGSRSAENALTEVLDAEGQRNPWLLEVGVLSRPLLGRVRMAVTYPDGQSNTFREGDLADAVADLGAYTGYYISSLAGPLASTFETVESGLEGAALGSEAEQRLFHLDEIKQRLPRDSSALVLIADSDICDRFVRLFQRYNPTVFRGDVVEELHKRLEAFHRRMAESQSQAQKSGEGAPAMH